MEHNGKGIMALLFDAAVTLVGMAIAVGGVTLITSDAKQIAKKVTPKVNG